MESTFFAGEGLVIGASLSIVTSYLLFENYPSFEGLGIGFPVPWLTIGVVLVASLFASVLATWSPARSASRIRPAVAVRVAD